MKKCFFATVFLIVNLFFLHSKSLYNDGNNGEYTPYSWEYNTVTYSPFPSETNNTTFYASAQDDRADSYSLFEEEAQLRSGSSDGCPPGFEGCNALGTEMPAGNLVPLILFSGVYLFRIILKKKLPGKL